MLLCAAVAVMLIATHLLSSAVILTHVMMCVNKAALLGNHTKESIFIILA